AVLEALQRADLVHWCGHTRAGADACWALPSGESLAPTDLRGARLAARLVVCNSCGDEQALPFARAFLLAGARNVVGTAWELEDAPAERFALHLHEDLALGRTIGESLAAARAALAEHDPLHG